MAYERQSVGGRPGNHNVAPYLLTDVHERCTGPSAIDFVVNRFPEELSQIAFPMIVLPRDDRTDCFREERLGLPNWTMILAICASVDVSKYLGILT